MYKEFTIEINCWRCGEPYRVKPNSEGFVQWIQGEALIQDAMPELNAAQRELLMSGTCDRCWNALFPYDKMKQEEN